MNEIWTPEQEAARLHARFDALKADGMGQAEFARVYSVPGGASMVSQHIKGRRPLSLEHAIAYAKGFRCPVSEISPRLAKEAQEAISTRPPTTSVSNVTTAQALEILAQGIASLDSENRVRAATLLENLAKDPAGPWAGVLTGILTQTDNVTIGVVSQHKLTHMTNVKQPTQTESDNALPAHRAKSKTNSQRSIFNLGEFDANQPAKKSVSHPVKRVSK